MAFITLKILKRARIVCRDLKEEKVFLQKLNEIFNIFKEECKELGLDNIDFKTIHTLSGLEKMYNRRNKPSIKNFENYNWNSFRALVIS